MLVFLDSNILIYYIEGPSPWSDLATARLQRIWDAGDQPAISDLVRMECRVGPLIRADTTLLTQYDAFFAVPDLVLVPLSRPVFDRAAALRAAYRFRTPDALNVAAAIEAGCGLFLTQDAALGRVPDLAIEALG